MISYASLIYLSLYLDQVMCDVSLLLNEKYKCFSFGFDQQLPGFF
jgi:hypothetical protein